MGAAGSVTIYNEEKVRAAYKELWGDKYDIEKDWWYPSWLHKGRNNNVVRVELGGVWYLMDYADDQGNHEGTATSFWFLSENWVGVGDTRVRNHAEVARQWAEIDEKLGDDIPWEVGPKNRGEGSWIDATPAQARVLAALKAAGSEQSVEVWT